MNCQSQRKPDIAELAGVGPANLTETDANDVRIIGQRNVAVFGKEAQLLSIAVAVVKDDRALPAAFLIVIEFAQVSDDALPRAGSGANALDQRIISMRLALLGTMVASEKHPCLQDPSMVKEARKKQGGRFPLHRQNGASTTKKPRFLRDGKAKKVEIFYKPRNIG